jgi:hypothetical protein
MQQLTHSALGAPDRGSARLPFQIVCRRSASRLELLETLAPETSSATIRAWEFPNPGERVSTRVRAETGLSEGLLMTSFSTGGPCPSTFVQIPIVLSCCRAVVLSCVLSCCRAHALASISPSVPCVSSTSSHLHISIAFPLVPNARRRSNTRRKSYTPHVCIVAHLLFQYAGPFFRREFPLPLIPKSSKRKKRRRHIK